MIYAIKCKETDALLGMQSTTGSYLWVTYDKETAKAVIMREDSWRTVSAPAHGYKPDELTVIELIEAYEPNE
jgi:hypothetical protein